MVVSSPLAPPACRRAAPVRAAPFPGHVLRGEADPSSYDTARRGRRVRRACGKVWGVSRPRGLLRRPVRCGDVDQPAALGPQVPGQDAAHLIEEELAGHAAEEAEGGLQTRNQSPDVLAWIELKPQEPRVA